MICFPNAKINLGLNIVSKREDGYHNLETIFYPLPIHDALEILPTKGKEDIFIQEGLQIDGDTNNNLVMKALKLMRKHYSFQALEVHLLKKIPFGAGIGGGSADASFMLKLINDKFQFSIDDAILADLAVQLGADCPFFIYNRPMFASGIGEKFENVSLSLDSYYLVLVKPDIHIPTRDAFAMIKPEKPTVSLKEIIKRPIEEWRDAMYNDFEKSIFPKYPEVEKIKSKLYEQGAIYASMSGSGSSVYALFKESTNLKPFFPDCYVWEEGK